MAEQTTSGTDWQADELDAIIADYFDMLAADLEGRAYSKSRHRAALMSKISRSDGSIEFKHQNISAVLNELGAPWIPGYKPARNYQGAIVDAIDRYLSAHPEILLYSPASPPAPPPVSAEIFVLPPVLAADDGRTPERLKRLIRKFDPVERDHRNRTLGKAGEEFVLDLEKRRLTDAQRPDLASRVRWTADEDGDGAGYDVASFDPYGGTRLIEVKTTNGSAQTPFFISRNECAVAIERPQEWQIYRVHLFSKDPRIFTLSPPLENAVKLTAETWRASF